MPTAAFTERSSPLGGLAHALVPAGIRREPALVPKQYSEYTMGGIESQRQRWDAEELLRTKNEFLCLAAHDLCQPVQSLELVISAIGQTLARPSTCEERLHELSRLSAQADAALARMRELSRMLLEIARLESGTVRAHPEPTPVAEIFEHLERQFAPVARAKTLAFHLEPSAHLIYTDPALLRGVLANLIANALRYTPRGEVRLQSVVVADGSLQLTVRDTGIGIAPSELGRIFEDFCRLDAAQRLTREGFGLGLGLVRRLSALLGLPVHVESTLGHGSAFTIEVPTAQVFCLA